MKEAQKRTGTFNNRGIYFAIIGEGKHIRSRVFTTIRNAMYNEQRKHLHSCYLKTGPKDTHTHKCPERHGPVYLVWLSTILGVTGLKPTTEAAPSSGYGG